MVDTERMLRSMQSACLSPSLRIDKKFYNLGPRDPGEPTYFPSRNRHVVLAALYYFAKKCMHFKKHTGAQLDEAVVKSLV